jgi:hypothetical protein
MRAGVKGAPGAHGVGERHREFTMIDQMEFLDCLAYPACQLIT